MRYDEVFHIVTWERNARGMEKSEVVQRIQICGQSRNDRCCLGCPRVKCGRRCGYNDVYGRRINRHRAKLVGFRGCCVFPFTALPSLWGTVSCSPFSGELPAATMTVTFFVSHQVRKGCKAASTCGPAGEVISTPT
jgi:hypothetical protein